jgi:mannose-6-phosphate isomerase-like protein (cupin superfamily)
MAAGPMIISGQDGGAPGLAVRGASLVIQDWPAAGPAREYAPLHVHHADDEAWHVVSGALRFRFADDQEVIVRAGSTVLVPAGAAHTFGSAGGEPSRYIIILPARLDELISQLHAADQAEHAAIYRRHESEMLE